MRADPIVRVRLAIDPRCHKVAHHQPVRRPEAGPDLVVVRDGLIAAVYALLFDQRANRRRLRRNPHRSRADVADNTRPHVRALVAIVLIPVRSLLGAPAADRSSPAHQRDLLPVIVQVKREAWVGLARLRDRLAVVVVGQLVPDIAAIHDHRQLHGGLVVLGQRWQLDRDAQPLKVSRRVASKELLRCRSIGQPQLRQCGLGRLADEVAHRQLLPGHRLVRHRPALAIHAAVFKQPGGRGHALSHHALQGRKVVVRQVPRQHRHRLFHQVRRFVDHVLALKAAQVVAQPLVVGPGAVADVPVDHVLAGQPLLRFQDDLLVGSDALRRSPLAPLLRQQHRARFGQQRKVDRRLTRPRRIRCKPRPQHRQRRRDAKQLQVVLLAGV